LRNGDIEIGDYLNGNKIGIHATIGVNGEITKQKYRIYTSC